jgi:putative transposase
MFDPEIVYVTVCADKRKPILAAKDVHQVLVAAWVEADDWLVGRYVLMPDHLHLLYTPATSASGTLEHWVKYWKSKSSTRWPRENEQPVWQINQFSRLLRSDESYRSKSIYVSRNPVRAGLVADPEEWPFGGEIHRLRF